MNTLYSEPNPDALDEFLSNPPGVVAVDAETVSLKNRFPIGLSIASSPDESFYFPLYPDEHNPDVPWSILENTKITKVFHNAPFDLSSIPIVHNLDMSNIADTNVMARLLNIEKHGLDDLTYEYMGERVEDAKQVMQRYKAKDMRDLPEYEVASKCSKDTTSTYYIYNKFWKEISASPELTEAHSIDMQVIPLLIDMGSRGIHIHQEDRAELEEKLQQDYDFYKARCEEEDINPASNQQVGVMLTKRGNHLKMTKSRKQMQVNVDALSMLDDPLAALVLQFRRAQKLLSTYIRPWGWEDRVYSSYNLDAIVGRISSSNKNLQNIPFEIRYILCPDSGMFTSGDYSQEHLRILAARSGDKEMLRIYEDGYYGGDIHQYLADKIHVPRKIAKTINYTILYGAEARTIQRETKIPSRRRNQELIDGWKKTFYSAAAYIDYCAQVALHTGYAEPTLFGHRIRIPDSVWENEGEEGVKRKGGNYPILGSDGEIMKRALLICNKYNLPLAMTVHDSISCDGDIEFPVDELENITDIHIPFEVKKTMRWE